MKVLRILLGLGVTLAVLWIILFEQLAGASANAFINARLTTIYAPIKGRVELRTTILGSVVSPDQELAVVEDISPDSIRRDDVAMELELARADVERVTILQEQIEAELPELDSRTQTYRDARLEEIGVALEAARERLELLRSEGAVSDADLSTGDVLDEDADRTRAEPSNLPLALVYSEERVATLEIEQAAIRDGVYLGDGYNDAPFSEQRAVSQRQELNRLDADLAAAKARVAAFRTRLQTERRSVNARASATLGSPVRGLIWELRSDTGEMIQRGMPLLVLANCEEVIVSLSVTESVFNGLKLGQSASFRPTGTSQVFEATVSRLSGPGSDTIYRNLAVSPSQRHLERYDVTLLVPGLRNDPDYSCAIGRTGRAFFETRPLDALREMFR